MSLFNKLQRFFKSKPKPFLVDNTHRIVPAFDLAGETYYMHEDTMNTATGRGLTAMMFMDQLMMRCSENYLRLHVKACEEIFTNPKKIDIPTLIRLNTNLKERVELMTVFPDHVYKLASVVFFTKEESPFIYDLKYNEEKIKKWKQNEGIYDFFLQTPLKTLVPFLELPSMSSKDYSKVMDRLNQIHLQPLQAVLSKIESTNDM